MRKVLVLMFLVLSSIIFAQFQYEFITKAFIDEDGGTKHCAVGLDGTIFVANGGGGLLAYEYDGSSFTNIGNATGINGRDVAIMSDGTIIVANNYDGLVAYSFDGSTFTQLGSVTDGGRALKLAVSDDETIFVANGDSGLWAYNFDGSNFTNTASIDDGGSGWGIDIGYDGTIFLANNDDGLRAYEYDGSSFTNKAHIVEGVYPQVRGVAARNDGIVFTAAHGDGMYAYDYDGASFTNLAQIGSSGGFAKGIDIGYDGTIFMSIDSDGLRAYEFDGTTITNTAYTEECSQTMGVTVADDGTLFVCNDGDGFYAFEYSHYTGIFNSTIPTETSLNLNNYPNPFNPATTISFEISSQLNEAFELCIYNIKGQKVRSFSHAEFVEACSSTNSYSVVWNGTDQAHQAVSSGLYFYSLVIDNEPVKTKRMVLVK